MEDPRIQEILGYIDTVDDSGQPTSVALIARRIASYLEVIAKLRLELESYHAGVEALEQRAENLTATLEERRSLREDITQMAQDAAVKAAFSTSSGRGGQLRKDAVAKRKDLTQFETDYKGAEARLKEVRNALVTGQARLTETRDQIARRMNIIDALLQRAEIEWPTYFFEENTRIKGQKDSASPAGTSHRRRRGRGRTRIIRRRKAS